MTDSYAHKGLRKALVQELVKQGIQQPEVLAALLRVPRHLFIESAFWSHAYQNKPFPIGEGQTISQPYTVARQTELLKLQPGQKVLEIGTGSGYQCAVLCELQAQVHSIEVIKPLHQQARQLLRSLSYSPKLYCADGSIGLPAQAPFDAILVTAGAPTVPEKLIEQLRIGGRLVIPVGNYKHQQMLRLTRTSARQIQKEDFGSFSFVPLTGEGGW